MYLPLSFILIATPLVKAYKSAHQRIYTLPAANRFIATWMIISSIVAVVGQELVVHGIDEFMLSNWSMRVMFREGGSLMGPCQTSLCSDDLHADGDVIWSMKRFSIQILFVCRVLQSV